jgi:hypothetical protein
MFGQEKSVIRGVDEEQGMGVESLSRTKDSGIETQRRGYETMRNLGCFLGLSLIGLAGCQQQEPAAAPLAPPPPTAPTPAAPVATADVPKEAPKPPALTGEQKAKLYQECWAAFNAKDWTKFSGCYADNASSEQIDAGMPPSVGKSEIVEKQAKLFANAFPDLVGDPQLTLVNGNNVVSVNLMKGTNKGPVPSPQGELAATNKKVGYLMAHGVEFSEDNKVKREWLAYDGGTFMGQLGLIPSPHRKVQEAGATDKPVVVATNSDAEKNNIAVYKQGVDAFNKHDVPGFLATLADDAVYSEQSAPADRVGKKEIQKGFEEFFKGFPDAKIDIKQSWAAGDYVFSHGTLTGTNTGAMPSMRLWKKTDKPVNVQFIEIDKIQGGKIKSIWMFSNGLAWANQLGMMPPVKGAKPAPKADAAKADAGKPAAAKPAAAGSTPAPGKPPTAVGAGQKSAPPVPPPGPNPNPPGAKPPTPAPAPAPAKPPTPPVKQAEPPKAPATPAAPAPAKPPAPPAAPPAAPAPKK